MLIRTGILFVPVLDDAASAAIRDLLHQTLSRVVILQEQSAQNQRNWVEEILRRWCDEEYLDLILIIGGCYPAPGLGAAEIVPEATQAIADRLLPGLAEEMRRRAALETRLALLHRGLTVIRSRSLIINLPAGAAPALLFLESIVDLLAPAIAHVQQVTEAPTMVDEIELSG
jgi:molybdopterin biosynthesis enzyme MoaB